jgi:CRISPR system Cascade subunit CasA
MFGHRCSSLFFATVPLRTVWIFMLGRLVLALSGAASLAGCATYRPVPVSPVELAHSFQSRTLDATAASVEIRRLAPAAAWNGVEWDRLSLFAAALRSNPAINEARAHALSSEAAAKAARAGAPVTLTLTAEYARNAPESSPWLYGVTSDVPLDLGQRRASRMDAAGFAAMAARYDYAEAVWSARMHIVQALSDALLAAREEAAGQVLQSMRARQLAALQARVAGGEALRSDLERLRADAAADARRVVEAQAKRLAALSALSEAVGVAPAQLQAVQLAWDRFEEPAELPAGDRAGSPLDLQARADVLRAVSAYDQAEADLRLEVARQWPELHVGPGYTWERGLVKLPFSVALVLPPADLNRANIAAAEARRVEAGVHLEAVVARAQAAHDKALIEATAARESLKRIRAVDAPTAQRFAQQADKEIAEGSIDRVDWSAAQVSLQLAKLAEIDALRRVHAADAALEDALRGPLDGPELQITAHAGERR